MCDTFCDTLILFLFFPTGDSYHVCKDFWKIWENLVATLFILLPFCPFCWHFLPKFVQVIDCRLVVVVVVATGCMCALVLYHSSVWSIYKSVHKNESVRAFRLKTIETKSAGIKENGITWELMEFMQTFRGLGLSSVIRELAQEWVNSTNVSFIFTLF